MSGRKEFLVVLCDDLREKVIAKQHFLSESQKRLTEKNFDLSVSELAQIDVSTDRDLSNYWIGLFLYKVKDKDPVGLSAIPYIQYFESHYDENPPYKDSLCSLFASFIMRELMGCNDVNEIEAWMSNIMRVKNRGIDIKDIMNAATMIYTKIMWNRLGDIMGHPDLPTMILYLVDLKKGQDFGIENHDLIKIGITRICKAIEYQNDIFVLSCKGHVVVKDYQGARQCIGHMRNISFVSEEIKTRIDKIQEIVGEPIAPCDPVPAPSEVEEPRYVLDSSKIVFQGPIYASQTENFGVVIYRATSPEHPLLAVKEYTANKDITDLDKFTVEIQVLQKLSDLANDTNCFLKFYGSWTVENRLYLVMEYAEQNLMSVITEYRKMNHRVEENQLKGIIHKLIYSFAEMEAMKIYHQDIKPHNLLVTQNFDLKIIDFSISEVKNDIDMTSVITGQNPVQGTRGYMAPELQHCFDTGRTAVKFKPGKADVFSLGITILQLVILEDLFSLNREENNDRLLDKVDSLSIEWLKSLLHSMLAVDYHKRKSFKHLLALVPSGHGTTYKTAQS